MLIVLLEVRCHLYF